jgi:hypothetical protein
MKKGDKNSGQFKKGIIPPTAFKKGLAPWNAGNKALKGCSVCGTGVDHAALGLCKNCYQKKLRSEKSRLCAFLGCTQRTKSHDFCGAHRMTLTRSIPKVIHGQYGYNYVYAPEHPRKHNGRVHEEVLIVEKSIGRFLNSHEVVHHINGIKNDNRLENLQLCTKREHCSIHARLRGLGTVIQPVKRFKEKTREEVCQTN